MASDFPGRGSDENGFGCRHVMHDAMRLGLSNFRNWHPLVLNVQLRSYNAHGAYSWISTLLFGGSQAPTAYDGHVQRLNPIGEAANRFQRLSFFVRLHTYCRLLWLMEMMCLQMSALTNVVPPSGKLRLVLSKRIRGLSRNVRYLAHIDYTHVDSQVE